MGVRTQVSEGKGFKVIGSMNDLPIIYPPIVLPAPAPGVDRAHERRTLKVKIAWYRSLVIRLGWTEARPCIIQNIKMDIATYWFLFKVKNGIIKNDRTWLFKR